MGTPPSALSPSSNSAILLIFLHSLQSPVSATTSLRHVSRRPLHPPDTCLASFHGSVPCRTTPNLAIHYPRTTPPTF
ncbi:unnamed protein product, partial [Protopolystoma xenopodis]